MAKAKKPGGTAGKGGVNPAPSADDRTVRIAAEQLTMVSIDDLVPYANNAKKHSARQISQIRASLREFGFVTPVLIDFDNNIIAGHGRVEAARAEGMSEVPCVLVTNLTEAQRKAYILADNRLSETAAWDPELLQIELEGLEALRFDTGIIGFDADSLKAIEVNAYTRAAPGKAAEPEGKHFWGDEEGETSEEYEAFTDKFKRKLTTDDCYTPENIYTAIRDWAVEHYGLGGAQVLRPFYPGGDYEHADYPEGCVVIDNPPFSILSQICRFYMERGIRFFLFAPALTVFCVASGACNYLPMSCRITYENGADVRTSFVTNLGKFKIETCPELWRLVNDLNTRNVNADAVELPGYTYPACVMTSIRIAPTAKYVALQIPPEDASFARALDAQAGQKKSVYGACFLLSEKAAAEKAAAEKVAAEKAAAEKVAAEKAAAEKRARFVWELSEREKELVKSLGKH